jgi:O-antigen ligase
MGDSSTESKVCAPEALVCLLAAILPLIFIASLLQPFVAAKELLLAASAPALLLLWAAKVRSVALTPLWWPITALVTLGACSLRGVTRYDTALLFISGLVIFAFTSSAISSPAGRTRLAAVFTAVGALEAAYVLWQTMAGDPVFPAQDLPGKWRAFGTFGNPNWTGEFLVAAMLVTLGGLYGKFARLSAAALALMAAGLACTFSRGAWLSLGIGIVALLRMRGIRLPRKAVSLAAGAFLASLVAASFRPDMLRYLVNSDSLHGRLWIWMVTARMIAGAPWGVGTGAFGMHFPEVQARMFQTAWGQHFLSNASFTPTAHNDLLQLTAESGWVALPAIVALLWLFVRRGRKLSGDSTAAGFWAAMLAMLVNGLFASPLYLPGSLGIMAILLGTVEEAAGRRCACGRIVQAIAFAAALAFGLIAWTWCWHRGVSEFELQRASVAVAAHQWPQARQAIEIARRHDPACLEVYSLLGRTQLAERQFPAAVRSYRTAASLGFDTEVLMGEATALWHSDDRQAAIAALVNLTRLRPDLHWPREHLVSMKASLKSTETKETR